MPIKLGKVAFTLNLCDQDNVSFQGTIDEWQKMFYIGACVGVVGAVIFLYFGSTELQDWSKIDMANLEKVESEKKEELSEHKDGNVEGKENGKET